MAVNTTVAATPKVNIIRYGRHFRLKPFLFANRKVKMLSFFSEYGGYLALQYTYI
jgi:hypothetical protein